MSDLTQTPGDRNPEEELLAEDVKIPDDKALAKIRKRPEYIKGFSILAAVFGGIGIVMYFTGGMGVLGDWIAARLGVQPPGFSAAIIDGMKGQGAVELKTVKLAPLPAGGWSGTAIDTLGREWELTRVWRDGKMIRWQYRQPREKIEEGLRATIAQRGEDVQNLELTRDDKGHWTGKVTTKTGLVLDIVEQVRGEQTSVMLMPTMEAFEAYLRGVIAQRFDDEVSKAKVTRDEQGHWQGFLETTGGLVFDIVEQLEGDQLQILPALRSSAYGVWVKKQIAQQKKIMLRTIELKKAEPPLWQFEGKDASGKKYVIEVRKGGVLIKTNPAELPEWTIRPTS